MSEQPTPRTDAAAWVLDDDELGSTRRVVDREFARQLERELAEAHGEFEMYRTTMDKAKAERDQWREVAGLLASSVYFLRSIERSDPYDKVAESLKAFEKLKEASRE